MVEGAFTLLEVSFPASGSIDIEALPPEQASINRPCAGAEHRNADSQYRHEYVNPDVLATRRVERESDPGLIDSNQGSRYGGPQPGDQEDTAYGGYRFLREGDLV